MSNEVKYYKRGFLNQNEGMAAFEADVSYKPDEETFYRSVCATFCITDCGRKIELDFYASNKSDIENNRHKLSTLISELQEFKNVLDGAYSDADFKGQAE